MKTLLYITLNTTKPRYPHFNNQKSTTSLPANIFSLSHNESITRFHTKQNTYIENLPRQTTSTQMNHTLASSIILNTLKSHTFNTPTVDNYSTDHIFALRSNILAIQTLDIDTRDPSPFESTISVLQKAVYHPARVHRHESVGPFDLGPLWLGSFLTFAYHHSTRLAYIRHVCVVLRDTWPP